MHRSGVLCLESLTVSWQCCTFTDQYESQSLTRQINIWTGSTRVIGCVYEKNMARCPASLAWDDSNARGPFQNEHVHYAELDKDIASFLFYPGM